MELLQVFEFEGLRVETYHSGTRYLVSKVYLGGELICEDNSFKPSPLYSIDDIETMVSLLWFYTLRSGDVEEGYFKDLNAPKLLEWSNINETANTIRMMLYDFENKEDDDYLSSNEINFNYCNRVEEYITTY